MVAACLMLLLHHGAQAQSNPDSDDDRAALEQSFGGQPTVTIATGAGLPLRRAPAVATVITAQDIAAMGATDLDEALEAVPGLHVSRNTQGDTPQYVIRGLHLGFNPEVLLLVNGVPYTTAYLGNRGHVWGGFPVEQISRIEVIRGPGSALYGAEAFAGVINIITRTLADGEGTQIGFRGGSFNTSNAWVNHSTQWGPVVMSTFLRLGSTHGPSRTVTADAQTGWDQLFGTRASHAPGPTNHGRDVIDGHMDLSLDAWRLRLAARERDRAGSGTGVASALDPTGQNYSQTYTADLSYERPQLAPNWGLSVQANWRQYKEFSDITLYPAGFSGFYNDPFQDGVIGNPAKWERHTRLSATLTYSGWRDHRTVLGLGTALESLYRVQETKNFNPDFSRIGTGSRADVIDVSTTLPFLKPRGRHKHHVYVQDEWQLGQDWALTTGLRHDQDSDFGGTTHPRMALVWEAAYNVTAKLLYGTAFRSPSFVELYAINNPVAQGNADLRPERMRTLEAAVSWQVNSRWQLSGNVYHYVASDIIRLRQLRYTNTGELTGNGLELESAWQVTPTWRLSGNHSIQRTIDESTGRDAGMGSHHQTYLRSDWQVSRGWSLHAQVNHVGPTLRTPGDTRDPLKGNTTVDLTAQQGAQQSKGWAFTGSIRNLFNADVREPSPDDHSAGQPFISLPGDLPRPGRSFYLQARRSF
jgi:outer membrane receptor for ferrienterochelin and colicins